MKIIRASVLGFCFGVRRAVELAEKALAEHPGKTVYSLGPLIHNEAYLRLLGTKGLRIIEETGLDGIAAGAVVIIRAHGVAPAVLDVLAEKGCTVIDATCPRVKTSQRMVEQYTHGNDFVIVSGDRNHGEMRGIAGYAGRNFLQLQDRNEAEKLDLGENARANVILMSQTTYSLSEFAEIESVLKQKIKNITVMNTICPATKERQDALVALCGEADGILVVGGRNSANTRRLFQTASRLCAHAAHIQDETDIPPEFFLLERVGITAGASTPDESISRVEAALLKKATAARSR